MANSLILAKAQNAVTAHDWSTAARLYKDLLRGDEANVDYLMQLGSIYVRDGQDEKAIPYYEQIITFHPDNLQAMVSLGGIFRRLKRYEDSVNILHKAQEIEPNSPIINYNLGFTLKEMGNYEDAIDSFETVINKKPDDVLAYNHLGSIYFSKKEYDKSISAFKKGLQVDQNHPILNYNLAHVYEDMHNFPEAVRCYENALKTRPGWLEAIRDFSELLIKCQNTKQAQELVEQSIKLHPDDVELLCILGRIYLSQFDYDNATKTFSRAQELRQNDIKILTGLSKALEKSSDIEDAMNKIVEASELEPENLEVCKQYAHVLLSAQRYDKALELIQKLDEKTEGKDVQVQDLYAQHCICSGDGEAAAPYFEKIKKLNHHYKDWMVNAADRYIQTGNYDDAEKMGNMFVQSRPQLPEGYNILGTVQSARGNLNQAKTEYEKGISLQNPNIYAVKELEKIYSELEKNQELGDCADLEISSKDESCEAEKKSEIENETAEDEPVFEKDFSFDDSENEEQLDALKNSLETNPPIEQAISGEEEDFWEDFDDDSDSPKKLIDEESEADLPAQDYTETVESVNEPEAAENSGYDKAETGIAATPSTASGNDYTTPVVDEDMIHQVVNDAVDKAVEKAVDKAVEEKLQEYNLEDNAVEKSEPETETQMEIPDSMNTSSDIGSGSATQTIVHEKTENSEELFMTVEELRVLCGDEPDDFFVTADDMFFKINRILNDTESAKTYASEIELFKTLRALSAFLPEKEKMSAFSCRMRILIEYVIARLSGKPGLLLTAESLIKSGVLGEEYNKQLEANTDEELSNDLICHVLRDMKDLAQGLRDKDLCNALCVTADSILEQIALINQQCAIF